MVLFSNQNWGAHSIKALIGTKHQILMVYTHPTNMDKNEKVWYESVKDLCVQNNINVKERITLTEEDEHEIRDLSPDVIFSIGWRRLIPRSVYSIPRHGAINLHEGLLPYYRGFAPTNWSIINGETETGVTVHYVDEGADTGDIILQEKVSIRIDDTAMDVYNKTLALFPSLLLKTITLLETSTIKAVKQDRTDGFFCTKRFPKDGRINWHRNRLAIYNLVRALSDPYPNAFFFLDSRKFYVKKVRLSEIDFRGPPGRVCSIMDNGIVVTCGDNHKENQALVLLEIAAEDGTTCNPKDIVSKLWIDLE